MADAFNTRDSNGESLDLGEGILHYMEQMMGWMNTLRQQWRKALRTVVHGVLIGGIVVCAVMYVVSKW